MREFLTIMFLAIAASILFGAWQGAIDFEEIALLLVRYAVPLIGSMLIVTVLIVVSMSARRGAQG